MEEIKRDKILSSLEELVVGCLHILDSIYKIYYSVRNGFCCKKIVNEAGVVFYRSRFFFKFYS